MNMPALTGSVVEPSRVISPQTAAVAKVGEVLKHLATRSGVYHNEEDQRLALEAIDSFRSAFSDGNPDVREEHVAPREDVSQRVPPQVGLNVPAPAIPQIDYTALARAMLAVQQEGQK